MQPALNPPGRTVAPPPGGGPRGPCGRAPLLPRTRPRARMAGRRPVRCAPLQARGSDVSRPADNGRMLYLLRRHLPRPRPARQDVHTHGAPPAARPVLLCCSVYQCHISTCAHSSMRAHAFTPPAGPVQERGRVPTQKPQPSRSSHRKALGRLMSARMPAHGDKHVQYCVALEHSKK